MSTHLILSAEYSALSLTEFPLTSPPKLAWRESDPLLCNAVNPSVCTKREVSFYKTTVLTTCSLIVKTPTWRTVQGEFDPASHGNTSTSDWDEQGMDVFSTWLRFAQD